jgi:two-component system repressor protein LuxO
VRELANAIHNIVVLNAGAEVTLEMLPRAVVERRAAARASPPPPSDLALGASPASPLAPPAAATLPSSSPVEPLWRAERRLVEAALAAAAGNVVRAAAMLELSPSTLYRKLQSWGPAEIGRPRSARTRS